MLELYKNIKKYRIQLGITQQELAVKAGYKDKSMIAKIEKGLVDLPQSKIAMFADIFHISQSELMGWTGKNSSHSPRIIYTFDEMVSNERPFVMQILSGFCKTRRIEKNYTEKYVATKSAIDLFEYIEFEEGSNIGLLKIKQILRALDIELEYMEYLLDQYCVSYEILTEMNSSPLILEHLAKQAAKFNIEDIADEYNRKFKTTKNNIQHLNAAHKRTDIETTNAMLKHDNDIMDSDDF